ncbi:MAG: TonB-dependent receptor, partial [Acidobacteriota bacterium]|nr:TonB-dependent receptor [Acidobacteriota bacterium]
RLFDDFNATFVPPETGRIGLTVFGQSNLSSAIDYPRLNPSEQRFELADNLSWTAGRHTLKFGFNYLYTQDYLNILRNQFGSYTYADFNRFALDFSGNATRLKNWQSYSQTFGNPILDLRTKDYSAYVQDQFRATRALTLNFGLRYEYADLPQPTVVNPAYPTLTGRINKPGKNFAPRAGLAYAFQDQKTVLRAGYGIFFQRVPGSLIQQFFFNNGVYQPQISLNGTTAGDLAVGPVLPGRLATGGGPPPGSVELQFAAKDFRTPYTQQGDIAIERQLTANLGLTVSYVFSRGVALFTSRDLNIGALGDPVTYRVNDPAGTQVGSYTTPTYRLSNRVDPRFRRLIQVENGGISYYNGLITQLQKRFSHGLQGSVAYTWSHAIDDSNQGGGSDVLFFSTLRSTYNGDYRSDRGSSLLDQRHRLVVNSIYQPTFTKSTSAFAKFFINNWQLSQITTVASAQPTTATIQVTSNFPGAAFTNTLNGFGGSTRVPFLPFNSLDVDRVFRTDARLTKGLPITERFQVFLNFEAFNVFNTQYNTGIISQAYTANNLVLTPNSRLKEGNQSQGFPDGTNARRMQASLRFVF